MKDFFTSFFNATKDRLSSAFFFNFLITWCIINWEIFLALFFVNEAKLPCRNLICYIKEYHTDVDKLIYKPVLFALILSFLLPLINALVDLVKRAIRKKRDFIVTKFIDGSTPASPETFVMLKNKLEETERGYSESMLEVTELRKYKEDGALKFTKISNDLQKQTQISESLEKRFKTDIDLCRSDEHAKFIIDKSRSTDVIVVTNGPEVEWNRNFLKFNRNLSGAFWITSEFPVNKDDAIKGKTYIIEHEFDLIDRPDIFKSITFNCLVDDELQLTINDRSVIDVIGRENVVGFDELHEFDIKEKCRIGKNTIRMTITNRPHSSEYSKDTNPYGIVFKVIGVYDMDKILQK